MQRATWARRDEATSGLVQAWQTAAFTASAWAGKLPPLERVLANAMRTHDRLNPAQQRTQLAMLSERMGVPMQPLSDAAKRALLRLRES